MTDFEALQRLVENDARNVRDCEKYALDYELCTRCVADCAAHYFQARNLFPHRLLVSEALGNLMYAVKLSGRSVDEVK